jgi:hypothetical protein
MIVRRDTDVQGKDSQIVKLVDSSNSLVCSQGFSDPMITNPAIKIVYKIKPLLLKYS